MGRYTVSLAHAGCGHAGTVVWEERDRVERTGREGGPVVVSLPRGFVSVDGEGGSIEIVCTGCRQTVASAAPVEPAVAGERPDAAPTTCELTLTASVKAIGEAMPAPRV